MSVGRAVSLGSGAGRGAPGSVGSADGSVVGSPGPAGGVEGDNGPGREGVGAIGSTVVGATGDGTTVVGGGQAVDGAPLGVTEAVGGEDIVEAMVGLVGADVEGAAGEGVAAVFGVGVGAHVVAGDGAVGRSAPGSGVSEGDVGSPEERVAAPVVGAIVAAVGTVVEIGGSAPPPRAVGFVAGSCGALCPESAALLVTSGTRAEVGSGEGGVVGEAVKVGLPVEFGVVDVPVGTF